MGGLERCGVGGDMAWRMLTISISQSLREKHAVGDSADSARITDPKKEKPCVCV